MAILLFVAAAGFVLWQNAHIAIFWDLSYLLDTSFRISLGQVPYRDFPLVHPPLTFLIQAALIRLAGRHYEVQIAYAALMGGLSAVVTWRILLRTLQGISAAFYVATAIALPLVFLNTQGVYPHPIYDTDCAFAILVSIWLLLRLARSNRQAGRYWQSFAAGASVSIPLFFKQNMGAPYALCVAAGLLICLLGNAFRRKERSGPDGLIHLRILTGMAATVLLGLLVIQFSVGLNNYFQWTVQFAATRRLPGIADMFGIYQQPSFVWTLPALGFGLFLLLSSWSSRLWVRLAAIALASAPFVGSLVFLFLNDDLDERADNLLALWPLLLLAAAVIALWELRKGLTLARLVPFFVLAAIHGTFLSQQLWGSTYAIWPLLLILAAQVLATLPRLSRSAVPVFATVIGATFLVCGGLYAIGHERMNYLQIPDSSIVHATLPALRGMADPGPYLSDFEELVRFADEEIPAGDGILLLPGEDPFYFATARTPQFPVLLFDRTADPYSPTELMAEAQELNIRWVIVKTRLQSTENPLPDAEATMRLIAEQFALVRKLSGYNVYRRR